MIDLIEKHFNININVYTHDEPELLQIDRRSITDYDDAMNWDIIIILCILKFYNKLDIAINVKNVQKYLKI